MVVGVEIHEDVAQHCKESIARWKEHHAPARAIHHMDIIHGNALQIAADEGEASLGFDRIYIGAAVDGIVLFRLKKLLKPGGILVGPGKQENKGMPVPNSVVHAVGFVFVSRVTLPLAWCSG